MVFALQASTHAPQAFPRTPRPALPVNLCLLFPGAVAPGAWLGVQLCLRVRFMFLEEGIEAYLLVFAFLFRPLVVVLLLLLLQLRGHGN